MELQDIELFREILRRGSLSGAGERLSLSQPTVSRRLQRMEAELGVSLLERSGSRMQPTPAGMQFLDFADEVMRHWDQLQQRFRKSEDLSGELRVAASSTPGGHWAAEWVAKFAAAFRGVQLKLSIMDSRAVEGSIEAGECVVGFMGCAPRDPLITAVPVAEDEIQLITPATGAYADLPDPLPLAQLQNLPLVWREEGSGTRETVQEALSAAGFQWDWDHVVLEVDSSSALIAAVRAGVGVGFMSKNLWAKQPPTGIRALHLAGVPIRRTVVMVYGEQTLRHCPQAEAFVEFVIGQVRFFKKARRLGRPESNFPL